MTRNGHVKLGLASLLVVAAGCANKTQSGAAIGAASGAALGAGVGSLVNSSAGVGALIGVGAGTISGALIGSEMDEQDRRHREELRQSPPASGYVGNPKVSKDDVIDWSRHGVTDEIIIDRVDRSGTVFHLTAADENALREKGVSEDVVQAMKQTSRR